MVKNQLNNLKRQAWKPIIQDGESTLDASKTSGKVWFSHGETWPVCPNCQNPMRLVLQLNLQNLPNSLEEKFGSGLLQLFCCESNFEIKTGRFTLREPISVNSYISVTTYEDEFGKEVIEEVVIETSELSEEESELILGNTEPILEELIDICWMQACQAFSISQVIMIVQPKGEVNHVEVPEMEKTFPTKFIVGWEEIEDYPHPDEVEQYGTLFNDKNKVSSEYILLNNLGDKLAGWPCWAQDIEYPKCPLCNQKMDQFIFQLEEYETTNFPYPHSGLGVGYVVQCPTHKEQVAFFCQFT
ncbi:MAG: DUF1963 domain-containing protein [Nostoc sp.]|uniref:DUF1963 domain-containing protein n=1 Tax=Nostoc sp. TaxID=1180 RepID=UPI002FFABDD2